jgi:hypothetical protein
VFPVRYEHNPLCVLNKRQNDVWIIYRTVVVISICRRQTPIDRINLLGSQRRSNVFPVRYEHNPVPILSQTNPVHNIQK